MRLPGNIAGYDSVPLPAFDHLELRYITPDPSRKLRSWTKAAEVERRLDAFEWLAHVARRPEGIRTFALDFSTAYLMSFESALQILSEEKRFSGGIDKWLGGLPAYDLTFRGIRTLRHREAHIRAGTIGERRLGGHSRFTGSEGGSNVGWQWAPVSAAEFGRLKYPKLTLAELPDWNQLVEENLAMDLMRAGIQRLESAFDEAEK